MLWTLRSPARTARLSVGAIAGSFLLSVVFIAVNGWLPAGAESAVTWLAVGDLSVDLGLQLDSLSLPMLLVVTGVGGVIHVYSLGYLRDDPGFARYFACLSLFTFAMLGVVLANNFLMLFVFWELVGVSSYLLIGFWFGRPAAADAGKKAFLTNRVGDFGFLLGILLVWSTLGTLDFGELRKIISVRPDVLGGAATLAGLLIFCGAVGKSAQFPLHVWLPDAMEGPTPVSALIHAATMVAAGVYMLCRVFFLLDLPGSHALDIIGWIGGITALFAAVVALQQNDIKRILAYSTLSQLGYMVMAVGVGGPATGMYHLTTHAFFKALLFLGAGSVIHALHHQQNIWKMGGLSWRMPVTFLTFLVATLALCGVPPFSGFFSKDAVLAATLTGNHANYLLFGLGVAVAVLTTLYMFRLVFVVFLGSTRSAHANAAQESPRIMTWPLALLALPSALAGFWAIDGIYAGAFGGEGGAGHGGWGHTIAMLASLAAVIGGFVLAWRLYRDAMDDPLPAKLGGLAEAMRDRFYLDEVYQGTVIRFQDACAGFADLFDRWIIAGVAVRGVHGTTEFVGRALRLAQTGNLRTYAFLTVLGLALILYLALG
ncbi:MAG: NADH-quinone oxidoreductase subunit L [Verrucomicrobia bacterium]|nr:NADH-quinone oxidoreductase subunit L [Verrucomicrobiota bacterium]